VLEGDCVLII